MTIINFQENHRQNIKTLDKVLEDYRDKIKNKIHIACNRSYEVFKEQKKITLEDNYDFKSEEEEIDKVETGKAKVKDKNKEENNVGSFVQNLLKYTMHYAQDATRRTHYKKLLKYIRLIDLLFNEAKYNLISSSLDNVISY